MNSVWATTQSAIYVAMKHIFPDVPINAGCFAPIHVAPPDGTFLYARYPRPVAGCAAEVAQRIMEAVFGAMGKAIPERLFAAPAGTSGNFGLGGYDPEENRHYIMYLFSGGGYGGWWQTDGLTNGCSSVGISKTQPVEILEQHYPILFDRFALREGSGGAGRHRGGFGVDYQIRLLRGEAKASFLMDHGRVGPPGLLGGSPGAVNELLSARAAPSHLPRISRREKATCWLREIGLRSRRRAVGATGPLRSGTRRWWKATLPAATTPLTKPSGYLAAPRRRNSAFGDE
jgi:N-methylhydantoinase B